MPLETASIEDTLGRWRRKATNVAILTGSVLYLPIVLIVLAGEGPPLTGLLRGIVFAAYGILLLETVLWRVDYRIRIGIKLVAGYVLAIVGGLAYPQGPLVRAFALLPPLMATVFFGKKAGRIATGVSMGVLLFAPALRIVPGLAGFFFLEGEGVATLSALVWFQGIAMTAILLEIMVLLDRFHDVLMQSLADRTLAYEQLREEMTQRRRLEYEVARVADEERCRLGREIHDGVCQQLTAALLRSEALSGCMDPAQTSAKEALAGLTGLLEETIDEARAVAQGLCPLDADPEALAAALHGLVRQLQKASGVACTLEVRGDVRVLAPATANHLYRIAQEATTNAIKHAHAHRIAVSLHANEDSLLLAVEDDGRGLPDEMAGRGMGLHTMSYRADFIHGRLLIGLGSRGGIRIACEVPRRGMVESPRNPRNKP